MKRILIIEDDQMLADHLSYLLKDTIPDATIFTAFTLIEALQSVENASKTNTKFDVAIIDSRIPYEVGGIPEMNGLQLCPVMHALFPNCQVIHFSAYSHDNVTLEHMNSCQGVMVSKAQVNSARDILEIIQGGLVSSTLDKASQFLTKSGYTALANTLSNPNQDDFDYDLAISFAGEDRNIASVLAEAFRLKGVRVFYDEYEQTNLWGEDLTSKLGAIYRSKSRFCIVIVSKNYAEKKWCRHEFRNAMSRALEEESAYVLPIKLDDTELDGLPPSTGYIDLRMHDPSFVVELAIQKLTTQVPNIGKEYDELTK